MSKGRIIQKLEPDGFYLIELIEVLPGESETQRLELLIESAQVKIDAGGDAAPFAKILKSQYQEQLDFLEGFLSETPKERYAWLCDFPVAEHEPKVGELVGIIDIDREYIGDNLNIQPSFFDEHPYESTRDGIMKNVALVNPYWAYFNLAVSPAVQRDYPRYRHGEIYDIDYENDKCSVNLDAVFAKPGNEERGYFLNRRITSSTIDRDIQRLQDSIEAETVQGGDPIPSDPVDEVPENVDPVDEVPEKEEDPIDPATNPGVYSLFGRMLDWNTGLPVENIKIVVYLWLGTAATSRVISQTDTNVDGEWSIGSLGEGVYKIKEYDPLNFYITQYGNRKESLSSSEKYVIYDSNVDVGDIDINSNLVGGLSGTITIEA